MSSKSCTEKAHINAWASRILLAAPALSSAGFSSVVRLSAIALTGTMLAACAQSPVVANKSDLRAASRRTPPQEKHSTSSIINHRAAVKKRVPVAAANHRAGAAVSSYGLASFYKYDGQTASGEKFDPSKLTAAHRTLPFGTRLRVTSVTTGRSVTVRINDRGPYVRGRVVDLSYAAAETLGIVGRGVAKVKLSVVQ